MGTTDWVAVSAYLSVAFVIGMAVYFAVKGYQLIYKKADNN